MVRRKKIDTDSLKKAGDDELSMVTEIDTAPEDLSADELEKEIPIMTLRNMVMFPSVVMPVTAGRRTTLKLVHEAMKEKKHIVIATQKAMEVEEPGLSDLYPIAVIGRVLRVFEMPGGNTTVILQASNVKVHLDEATAARPYLKGKVSLIEEQMEPTDSDEFKALMDTCIELSNNFIDIADHMSPDIAFALKNLPKNHVLVNYICTNFPLSIEDKFQLLKENTLKDRLYSLIQILNRETKLANLKQDIQMRTREDLDKQQREYFLQQQIKTIQDELGGGGQEQEIEEMRQKAERMRWNLEVRDTFMKELAKLERTHPQSPDYSVQLNYLQTMLNLPWGTYTTDNLNLKNAEKTLNKDHYGLEKVKEGGVRCFKCYELRLRETAEIAKEGGYDYFTTTLSISPLKNAAKLNEIGLKLAEEYGVSYLTSDFKKKNGYKRSVELSAQYGLYRQDYCGCEFSMRQRLEEQRAKA